MMFLNTLVTVLACSYSTLPPSFDLDGITVPNASLRIVFRNAASMPSQTMRFDVGAFSRLVTISHDLAAAPDAFRDGPRQCSVDAVNFAGGSHWTRR